GAVVYDGQGGVVVDQSRWKSWWTGQGGVVVVDQSKVSGGMGGGANGQVGAKTNLVVNNGLQKPICGQQGFEVTCNSKTHLIINLSNDTYAIQGIFYEFQSMHILNTAFIDATFNCTLGLHSFTLDENRFKFACTHSEVFLLQDCNNKVKNSIGEYKEESCIFNNKSRGNLIGIYAQGRNLSQFAGKCKKVVSVPYEGKNVTDIDGALRMGVQLKWNATNCRECAKSGGRCGYHNETSLQMQCFCPYGVHSLILIDVRNDLMKFSTNHDYVYVFPDCPEKVLKEYREKIVECGKLAVYKNDSKLQDLKKKCNGVVIEVPYYDEGQTKGKVMDMLERGVLLNWKAYNCTACLETGGHCVFDEPNNQFNCFCPDRTHSLFCTSSQPPIQGSSLGAVVLVTLIVIIICGKRRQRTKRFTALWNKGTAMNQNVEAFLKSYGSLAPKRYTYREIRKMTSNFKHKLGEGGYGAVYKGNQHDSRLVAVKKLKKLEGDGDDFINEVVSMGRTNHVNIVTLLGFCFEGNKRALVFEFLPNGSLEKFIYSSASGQSLPSNTLYSIAVGIAKGLDYLHRGCNTRILHFDIKPHNILLDEELRPKISDFGLARLCCPKESLISMSEARGTIGYIAPEVFCRNFGGVSHKSDVYSYGMMLLDMVCGRNNVVAEAQRTSDMYFPDWIYRRLELRDEIENDGIIEDDEAKQLQRKMILVGLWCIQSYPSNRPPMNRVLEMLEGQLESLQVPPKPHLSSPSNPIFNSSENSLLSMGN
uniref:non-specific serine/threonine protein kinase n=1 Tax=Chenopodium quinoa TaxID=63459 RepID=A0A803KUX3_CHEQI